MSALQEQKADAVLVITAQLEYFTFAPQEIP